MNTGEKCDEKKAKDDSVETWVYTKPATVTPNNPFTSRWLPEAVQRRTHADLQTAAISQCTYIMTSGDMMHSRLYKNTFLAFSKPKPERNAGLHVVVSNSPDRRQYRVLHSVGPSNSPPSIILQQLLIRVSEGLF